MPSKCTGCGSDAARTITTFNERGDIAGGYCSACRPEMFEGPVTDRSDRKLWTGIDAMPEKYKQGADGVYRAKDELISDTVAEMSLHEGDYDRQCANKRATRRTAALNETEIRAAQEWGKEAIREKHPELFGGHHEA